MVNEKFSSIAEDYFANLNPIAARIHNDITEIRLAYENLWDTLDHHEKKDIINESIIKPEISLKYALLTPEEDEISFNGDLSTFNSNLITGQKIVHDENISYRDEHSAPFNMKTNSQLNLNLFGIDSPSKPSKRVLPGAKPTPSVDCKAMKGFSYTNPSSLAILPALNKPSEDDNFISELKSRTQTPKNSKNSKNEEKFDYEKSIYEIAQSPVDEIPKQNDFDEIDGVDTIKSGYDFLDNW